MRILAAWCLVLLGVGCGGSTSEGAAGGSSSGGSGGASGGGATAGNGAGGSGGSANGGSGASGGSGGSASGGSGGSGGDSINHCRVPSDCVVIPASCCGSCGAATREDSIAVNKGLAGYARDLACGAAGMNCPGCYMPSDANLLSTCTAGKCQLIDLLASAATECEVHTDCRLRTNQCCECGGAQDVEHLVAVSDSSALEHLVCDPNIACTECDPGEPAGAEAQCQGGRCVVQWLLGN